jgi:hypothetical protein
LSLLSDKAYSRKDHFADLLDRLDLQDEDTDASVHSGSDVHVDDMPEDDIANTEDESEAKISTIISPLSLHRATFPPFVRLPNQLRPNDAAVPFQAYIPWAAGEVHDDEDSILSSDTDEEELNEELADESSLDTHDSVQDEAYQKMLWLTFEPQSEKEDPVVAPPANKKRKRTTEDATDSFEGLRKRKYRPRIDLETSEPQGKVKSAPFITDSDSE